MYHDSKNNGIMFIFAINHKLGYIMAHYIDNKKFTKAIMDHNTDRLERASVGKEACRISWYIGQCIIDIANRLATKRNFSGYTWKGEMIDDAIMSCTKAVTKFDPSKLPPEKKPNGLAYFTSVANRAFINRIQYENRQLELNDNIVIDDYDYRFVLDHGDTLDEFINLDNNNDHILSIQNKHNMRLGS